MKKEIKKFLRFNNKTIFFTAVDGTYWVAVKPICEVLNVDYIRQFKNLKKSSLLADVLSKQTMHDTTGRVQEMTCLPERYIYGWLFMIKSDSPELLAYQKEVYDVLFNHFNGMITRRQEHLIEREATKEEIKEIEKQIEDEKFIKLQELKERERKINKSLKKQDADLLHGQMNINI